MPKMSQPKYSESPHKFMAREFMRRLYLLLTANTSIPVGKKYITLCNYQDKTPTSEINQLVSSGLLTKNQFVGIDNEKRFVTLNKKNHKEAEFIHGNWSKIIRSGLFDPGLIYLDSTYFVDRKPALDALRHTMSICDKGALLICNVMTVNPRSGTGVFLNAPQLISGLLDGLSPVAYMDWNKDKENYSLEEISNSVMRIPSYDYRTTDKTKMRSFIFYKGVLPPEEIIKKEFDDFDSWCCDEFGI